MAMQETVTDEYGIEAFEGLGIFSLRRRVKKEPNSEYGYFHGYYIWQYYNLEACRWAGGLDDSARKELIPISKEEAMVVLLLGTWKGLRMTP